MTDCAYQELVWLDQRIHACRQCIEAGYDIAPGPVFSHPPDARIMLVGQAPGITEVEAKRPFNAGSGKRLFSWLKEAGWSEEDFRSRNVMTAVTKCYPGKGKNGKGDRVPSKAEQKLCWPFLEQEIRHYRPQVLILVGGLAIKLIYPARLKLVEVIGTAAFFPVEYLVEPLNLDYRQAQIVNSTEGISKQKGRWIVPLPHPSGASLWPNKPQNKALIDRSIEILRFLREAYDL